MMRGLPHSLNFIRHTLIEDILRCAIDTAQTNAFLQANLSNYIVQRQQQTIGNITHQSAFIPATIVVNDEDEPLPLKEDSLMAVSQVEPTIPITVSTKTVGKQSGKSSNGQMKGRLLTEKPEVPTYKSIARELNPQEFKRRESDHNLHDVDYISRLRAHIEAEERERLAHPPTEIRRQKPRPGKGERIVFDYEGNFGKGKEPKGSQFDQEVLSSSIDMARRAKGNSLLAQEQATIPNKQLDKSVRNRIDFRKEFEQSPQEKRELILNELKISNSRTKIVFDGHPVTRQEENPTDKPEPIASIRRRSSTKVPTMLNEEDVPLAKPEPEPAAELKSKEREGTSYQRSLIKTVASEGKKQRISIQNESLKKVLLTEVESRHFELPKSRPQRVINTVPVAQEEEDPDLARIRQKLNIRTHDDKLPRILSKYSHLERDILREIRKKSKA